MLPEKKSLFYQNEIVLLCEKSQNITRIKFENHKKKKSQNFAKKEKVVGSNSTSQSQNTIRTNGGIKDKSSLHFARKTFNCTVLSPPPKKKKKRLKTSEN